MWNRAKIRSFVTSWAILIALCLPNVAVAQGDEPLRLVYMNVSGAEGEASFRTVDELFAESQQIDLFDGERLLAFAAEYGIEREAFRSSQRAQYVDEFAALMWEKGIEGVMVHDVDSQTDTLYIGVIGPWGWELAQVEASLSQGALDRDGALAALGQIFDPLVPDVRGFRRDVEEGRITHADFQLPELVAEEEEEEEKEEELSLRDQAMEEHRSRYGNLERNVALRVGPAFGHRSMRMNDEAGFDIRHRAPLMGFALRADALLTTFDRDTAALEVGGFLGFSSVSTVHENTELDGQFFRTSFEARYISAQSAVLRIRGIGGIETTNLSLEENSRYTGHGYFAARLGGGVEYAFGELMTLQVDALAMPLLGASNSGDAYGEVSGWLGAGLDLVTHLNIADPILIGLDYGFRYFNVEYPDAGQVDGVAGEASSYDMIHQMMITLGYRYGF